MREGHGKFLVIAKLLRESLHAREILTYDSLSL